MSRSCRIRVSDNRNHLEAAELTEQQRWRDRWEAARLFVTADGESGKAGGNETIRVDESGRVRIKVPAALVGQFGSHLVLGALRHQVRPGARPLVSARLLENRPAAAGRAR